MSRPQVVGEEQGQPFVPGTSYTSTLDELQEIWSYGFEFPDECACPRPVSLVKIADDPDRQFAFKTASSRYKWKVLYHEIRTLLAKEPHPYTIQAPEYLVFWDSACTAGGVSEPANDSERAICGYLTPFIKGANLDYTLAARRAAGRLDWSTKVKWCRQLAEAMEHVMLHGYGLNKRGFHSDLKPNNVMVTEPDDNILLLDFEQYANWAEYTAPEVRSCLYDPWYASVERYSNPPYGYYGFWTMATDDQREHAMVYSLGRVFEDIVTGSLRGYLYCVGYCGIPPFMVELIDKMRAEPCPRPRLCEIVEKLKKLKLGENRLGPVREPDQKLSE